MYGFTATADGYGNIVETELRPAQHDTLANEDMVFAFIVEEVRTPTFNNGYEVESFTVTLPGDYMTEDYVVRFDGQHEMVQPKTWAKIAEAMLAVAADQS